MVDEEDAQPDLGASALIEAGAAQNLSAPTAPAGRAWSGYARDMLAVLLGAVIGTATTFIATERSIDAQREAAAREEQRNAYGELIESNSDLKSEESERLAYLLGGIEPSLESSTSLLALAADLGNACDQAQLVSADLAEDVCGLLQDSHANFIEVSSAAGQVISSGAGTDVRDEAIAITIEAFNSVEKATDVVVETLQLRLTGD